MTRKMIRINTITIRTITGPGGAGIEIETTKKAVMIAFLWRKPHIIINTVHISDAGKDS